MEYLPKPGQAAAVQIDVDPTRLGLRYPVSVGLAGDAGPTLERLLPMLQSKQDRTLLARTQKAVGEWWRLMEARGTQDATPMKPQVVAWELGDLLDDQAIVSADTGTVTSWAAQEIRIRRGQRFTASGNLASMANGLPYAIAAQVAFPGRQCVAVVGDGGFQMLMAEFATCVQHGLPVKVVVLHNNVLGMIKWEQLVFLGNPEYGVEMSPIDLAKFAEACGGTGYRIEDPKRCRGQLSEALATEGPVLVDAIVDPFEPPLPPKVSPAQVLHLAEALARGEPNRERVSLTLFRRLIDESTFRTSEFGAAPRIAGKVSELLGRDARSKQEREKEPNS
jgi:pyruvate dehydrogenase (quinone)/pyruvate oxidase